MGRWVAQLEINIGESSVQQAMNAARALQNVRMALSQINWVMFSGIFWIWTLERLAKAAGDYQDALTGVLRAEISLADVELRRRMIQYELSGAITEGDLATENQLRADLIRTKIDEAMATINLAKAKRDEQLAASNLMATQLMLGIQTAMFTLMIGNASMSMIQATTRMYALTGGHFTLTTALKAMTLGVDRATASIVAQGVATRATSSYMYNYGNAVGASTVASTTATTANYGLASSFVAVMTAAAPLLIVLAGIGVVMWKYNQTKTASDAMKKSILEQAASFEEAKQKWIEYQKAQLEANMPGLAITEAARAGWAAQITEEEWNQVRIQATLNKLYEDQFNYLKAAGDQTKANTASAVDMRRAIEAALEICQPSSEDIRSRVLGVGEVSETVGHPQVSQSTQELMQDYLNRPVSEGGSMITSPWDIAQKYNVPPNIAVNIWIENMNGTPADADTVVRLVAKKLAEQESWIKP